jgi:hypothetical protein
MNLVTAGGVARGWDSEFESALLQERVERTAIACLQPIARPTGSGHEFQAARDLVDSFAVGVKAEPHQVQRSG